MVAREKLRVLVPLDGSDPGQSALRAIYPLLRSGPVECTLLHVTAPGERSEGLEAHLNTHREALECLHVPTRIRFASGNPSEEILRLSGSGDYDLVAMSTHGRRGMDHVEIGSVAEDVVRSSKVPTVLCRKGTPAATWDRIVVALDGMPEAEGILEDVELLAPRLNATVHLLQVGLSRVPANSFRGVRFDVPDSPPTAYLDTVAARLMKAGIRVVTEHGSGFAAKEIVLISKDLGAGLICMTTRGLPEEPTGIGRSVAAEVIRQASCPVYVRHRSGAACNR